MAAAGSQTLWNLHKVELTAETLVPPYPVLKPPQKTESSNGGEAQRKIVPPFLYGYPSAGDKVQAWAADKPR
jgi:hypothetical protein